MQKIVFCFVHFKVCSVNDGGLQLQREAVSCEKYSQLNCLNWTGDDKSDVCLTADSLNVINFF